ncbi:2-dehydropantoate 2-reductase [Sphingosinicella sp. LHD-64]|uniref:2-dehydropantoate 2-reductase n=1 Tax=Sphingosinicella sp. LHD-64 TaxID=3072139 RepID=UPI00280FF152|nr:2-dehydropantoate 2-reductase [Sphingosinicella sp. LHD-64]MDQ8756161.1 2-dehydropantoate 2-reductase [Sphingosinicella sp. LHD-64]
MAELPDNPRIVIHGAGSIGCWIGGAWLASGLDITLLGRPSVRDEIAANGLTLTDSEKRRIELRPDEVEVGVHPKLLRQADVIVLAVKSTGTAVAAKEIAKHGRKGATVISFQNGVSNVETLKAALPGFTVLHGMVPFNVAHMGNGRWHKGVAGTLWAEDHPVTRVLAERIGAKPGGLTLSGNMTGVAWGKLLVNLNNAVNALSGRPLLEELGNRDYRRVWAAAQVEGLELLKAAGIEPAKIGPFPPHLFPHIVAAPDWLFNSTVLKLYKIDADARSSMADDFAAGRATEIEYLNGEVVSLARRLGREAPVNAAIVDLVRQAEAGVERAWDGAALRRQVLAGHRGAAGFGY